MKTCVILNPMAGSTKEIDTITKQLQRLPGAKILTTSQPGDATRFAKRSVKTGCDSVVAAGGDGTLNEVVTGIAAKANEIRLGLVPLGTGNDFARTLKLPASLEDNVDVLLSGQTKPFDLVRVKSRRTHYLINVSAGGFSGLVDEKLTAEIKQTWGPLAYVRTAAAAFPELHSYRTTIGLDDGEPMSLDLINVIVANGRFVAGGLPVAPEADAGDGLLDIILIPRMSTPEIMLLATEILVGKHLSNNSIIFRRAKNISIRSKPGMWFNADGELVGNAPVSFQVMPRAVNFVVGK